MNRVDNHHMWIVKAMAQWHILPNDDFLVTNFHELAPMMGDQPYVFHEQTQQCFFSWKKTDHPNWRVVMHVWRWKGQHTTSCWTPQCCHHSNTYNLYHTKFGGSTWIINFYVAMVSEPLSRLIDCVETLQGAKENHKKNNQNVCARKACMFGMLACT